MYRNVETASDRFILILGCSVEKPKNKTKNVENKYLGQIFFDVRLPKVVNSKQRWAFFGMIRNGPEKSISKKKRKCTLSLKVSEQHLLHFFVVFDHINNYCRQLNG